MLRRSRQSRTVRSAQVAAGALLAVFSVRHGAVAVLARSRERLGEGAAQPTLLLVVTAAGRAGAAQGVQGRHAVRRQLPSHRRTLVVVVVMVMVVVAAAVVVVVATAAVAGATGGAGLGIA